MTAGLTELDQIRLVEDTPQNLAQRLMDEDLDCALISPLDVIQVPFSRVIPGIGAATAGPAACQLVLTRGQLAQARRIAIDPRDGEGTALARVLLLEQFGATPEYVSIVFDTFEPELVDGLVVMSGASNAAVDRFTHRTDLSAQWKEFTGMPFVHMLWAARLRAPHALLRRILIQAIRSGVELLEQAKPAAQSFQGVYYTVGSEEMEGIRTFLRLAAKQELCGEGARIELC